MKLISASLIIFSALLLPSLASAHVAVTPDNVGIGSSTIFSANVPNESQQTMTSFALNIPDNLSDVIPTMKAGWAITISKKDNHISKLTWAEGTLEPGQRQDFTFSAQAPAAATKIDWKAYQTFADGSTTHWDQKPSGSDEASGNAGPYSITSVVKDIALRSPALAKSHDILSLLLAGSALLLSVYGLLFKKRA